MADTTENENQDSQNTAGAVADETAPAETKPKARTSRRASTSKAVSTDSGEELEVKAEKKPVKRTRVSAVSHVSAATEESGAPEPEQSKADAASSADAADSAEEAPAQKTTPAARRTRSRSRSKEEDNGADKQEAEAQPAAEESAAPAERNGDSRNDRNNNRSRFRDRKRKGGNADDADPEISEDDVLIPVAGILDILENYAFVRTTGYLPGQSDVYVSLGQVKKYNLRKGDAVVGAIRQPREGEQQGRQKYNALVRVDSINGLSPEAVDERADFTKLTALYPDEALRLETDRSNTTGRLLDLFAPLGKGQRGLVVAPPKSGRTSLIKSIAHSISENNPEVHLMLILIDERPEEVTELQRTIRGEIVASTFDRVAEDHVSIAELAVERAKRLVELGHDVVILLDSLTRLGRAYNLTSSNSGKLLAGGVDTTALYPAKRLFASARNIEDGGSLTIVATALSETGSRTDEVILEEFQDTANYELVLDRSIAQKRVFPAVRLLESGAKKEETLLGEDELKVSWGIRREFADREPRAAVESILVSLNETANNAEFVQKTLKSLPTD